MTEDDSKTTLQKEIDAMIEALKGKKSMTLDGALSAANEIVEKINKLIDIYGKTEDIGERIELYEKAKDAYITAAQKVPEGDRVRVLRPSSFWSMRADLAKVESTRPIFYPVTIRKKTSRALPSREKITGLHELLGEKRPEKLEFETQNPELEFEPKGLSEEYLRVEAFIKPYIKERDEKLEFETQNPELPIEKYTEKPEFAGISKIWESESKSLLEQHSKLKELGGMSYEYGRR